MVKPLPLSDFRAVRQILEEHEWLGGEEVAPTDLIDREIWAGIMDLPGDIAVQISSHHGSQLKLLHDLWGDWIVAVGDPEKPDNLSAGMLDAGDCFQCATFDFLHGYYRSSLSNLRSALELVTIGAYGNLQPDDPVYQRWRNGGADLTFPTCRSRLHKVGPRPIAWFIKQQSWPERLYYDLCRYTHSRTDASDGSLWESNGPVYSGRAIQLTFEAHLSVYGVCYLLAKLGRPDVQLSENSVMLFTSDWIPGYEETGKAFQQLFASQV